jgi:hypothetical protein
VTAADELAVPDPEQFENHHGAFVARVSHEWMRIFNRSLKAANE